MKKIALLCTILMGTATFMGAQTTVSQEVVALGTYGLADDAQAIHRSTEAGTWDYQKNATALNTTLTLTSRVAYFYDIVVKLNARSRVGSPYRDLQLVAATPQSLGVTIDTAYGRFSLLNVLGWADPFDLYLSAGKHFIQAANYQKLSPFGIESALNMLKLANTLNAGLELTYKVPVTDPVPGMPVPMIVLNAMTGLNTDEGVDRLYDADGLLGVHGTKVLGEFAPTLFTSLRASNLSLGWGTLSAEAVYQLNGAGTFSGNSFGGGFLLTNNLIPGVLTLPVGVGAAFYEKNIDVLSGTVRSDLDPLTVDITDYRNTLRVGVSSGIRYAVPDELGINFTAAGSYTRVEHMKRNPLALLGASVDGRITFEGTYFIGAGGVLGTLSDAVWEPSAGSVANSMTFRLAENYGIESYVGLNFGALGSVVLGVHDNKGLAMNYGLESQKDGEFKVKQLGTGGLYETLAAYLKVSFKL